MQPVGMAAVSLDEAWGILTGALGFPAASSEGDRVAARSGTSVEHEASGRGSELPNEERDLVRGREALVVAQARHLHAGHGEPSLEPLMQIVADDMNGVNSVILERRGVGRAADLEAGHLQRVVDVAGEAQPGVAQRVTGRWIDRRRPYSARLSNDSQKTSKGTRRGPSAARPVSIASPSRNVTATSASNGCGSRGRRPSTENRVSIVPVAA